MISGVQKVGCKFPSVKSLTRNSGATVRTCKKCRPEPAPTPPPRIG
jgi:hypothetical protein